MDIKSFKITHTHTHNTVQNSKRNLGDKEVEGFYVTVHKSLRVQEGDGSRGITHHLQLGRGRQALAVGREVRAAICRRVGPAGNASEHSQGVSHATNQ